MESALTTFAEMGIRPALLLKTSTASGSLLEHDFLGPVGSIWASRAFSVNLTGAGLQADLSERRFENVDFYETEAKLDLQEEEFGVALLVAPALLSESALSQTLNPA